MAADPTSPAARTLISHINSVSVQRGIEEGRWQVQRVDYPDVYVRIVATDPETGTQAQAEFHLRCDDFPAQGPFVERWDFEACTRPSAPVSGQASAAYVDALKDWGEQQDQHGGIYRGWVKSSRSSMTSSRPVYSIRFPTGVGVARVGW